MSKIYKIAIKELKNVKSTVWIGIPSTEGLHVGDQLILVDMDSKHVKGAIIKNIVHERNRIKVECLFRID